MQIPSAQIAYNSPSCDLLTMTVAVRSFAKINLGLYIGAARADGYHDLRTVYQTIALHDVIRVSVGRGNGIDVACTSGDPRVPLDSSNTCYRIAERVLDELGAKSRVRIEIEKRLPVQGGLGGASSNAVATMLALELALKKTRVLKKRLSGAARLRIAADVGSDLPLFLVGGTTLGVGRGEEVYPLTDLPAIPMVVVMPEVGVSTPQAFADWDALVKSEAELRSAGQPGAAVPTRGQLTASWASDRLVEVSCALSAWLSSLTVVHPTPVLLQKAGAGPGTCFSTLSVPGLKTTSRKSSFLNIPNCVT